MASGWALVRRRVPFQLFANQPPSAQLSGGLPRRRILVCISPSAQSPKPDCGLRWSIHDQTAGYSEGTSRSTRTRRAAQCSRIRHGAGFVTNTNRFAGVTILGAVVTLSFGSLTIAAPGPSSAAIVKPGGKHRAGEFVGIGGKGNRPGPIHLKRRLRAFARIHRKGSSARGVLHALQGHCLLTSR